MIPLPIDPLLPRIVDAVRTGGGLVLQAAPGAGKTTRVPRALLDAGVAKGRIVVLEPRRLATRLAATRVAEELGEKPGETIGYQVRFEDVSSVRTRVHFVTEGVLGRKLLGDPTLREVGAVVLDEFHERHLAGDLALAQLRELQRTRRPDLKLLVMSATIEADPVAGFLGDAPILHSEGRTFPLELQHLDAPDDRPLPQQVLAALKRAIAAGIDGHVLVFLPGAGEIRRTAETVAEFAGRHQLDVLPLHGDLPFADQDRAVRPSTRRKLILSTNVAETSVTIDGIGLVIDSGLARMASHSPWSGLPVLKVAKVSRASATQRAGRAGRTRAGVCMRLYTRHDFEARPAFDVPEIRRADLAETALALHASGVTDLSTFPFFEAPPAAALSSADALLERLGAVHGGKLTETGRRMLDFPLHPRQARMMVEGERLGIAEDAALFAALIGERDIRKEARVLSGRSVQAMSGRSDLIERAELFRQSEGGRASAAGLGLDPNAVQAVGRVASQLRRMVRKGKPRPSSLEDAQLQIALAGYPDRVARRRRPHAPELLLSQGGTAVLAETSAVREAELLVTIDAEERAGAPASVRIASEVDPLWLLELFPDEVKSSDVREFQREGQRVERVSRLTYGEIALEETRGPAPADEETAKVLAKEALAAGIERFVDPEALANWLARLELVSRAFPEAGFPAIDEAFLQQSLAAACEGLKSFSELREVSVLGLMNARLSNEQQRLLARETPDRITLPGGRQVKVQYARGQSPWIESRLQDFFGSASGPSVAQGRVPLVIHLLAPNGRAVQVTQDLAGFWERHYPALRKELGRKYPRHSWPEDPRHAAPPAPKPPRR